jgi:hypothetical protein
MANEKEEECVSQFRKMKQPLSTDRSIKRRQSVPLLARRAGQGRKMRAVATADVRPAGRPRWQLWQFSVIWPAGCVRVETSVSQEEREGREEGLVCISRKRAT